MSTINSTKLKQFLSDIPTNVIAIRTSLNSQNPTSIIIPVWLATIVAAIVGVTVTKILIKKVK